MLPSIGSYQLKPFDIPIDALYNFMLKNFADNQPKNMRYYYVIQDRLINLIENL